MLLAKAGPNRTIRILATQALGGYVPSAPELLATIKELATNDPDPELKSYAQRLVAKFAQK